MNKLNSTLNRTFGRRVGKRLSNTQKLLLDQDLPQHNFAPEKLLGKTAGQKIILEIGFGMGEHFVNQMTLNPNHLFIGAEVYLNGVANVIKAAKEINFANYMLWPNDIDLMINNMPPATLNGVYILFPDPWHKRRYLKKRLINEQRLRILKNKLKEGAFLKIATDIEDYFQDVRNLLNADPNFRIINEDFNEPHEGYILTKYHRKAIQNGRTPKFITTVYIA